MIIEFCMEIEGFDYLLDKIMKIYESKKFGDLFFSKLESFIICDKLDAKSFVIVILLVSFMFMISLRHF